MSFSPRCSSDVPISSSTTPTVRLGVVGASGGAGQVGTVGELLGVHDVVVAWICRLRLEPPAGWTTLADTDLVH
jgi:hypothetical protein